ncbi:chymotrypsin-like elastase family member 2A [Uloborus diversus]|uniref:chymotrypsin-like elastase family member 2A n=1 Tax=Uloborus diversus TaxID=327109 RepID=UPI0024098768|nr:chymotrypsin-like elastase family member 2A [Uloborus diversus]
MFPYMVALHFKNKFVCGGTLLSNNTVLTSAHCVVFNGIPESPEDFFGAVGSVNRSSSNHIRFKKIIVHPDYDNLDHDVALLKINGEIPEQEKIQPICLAGEEFPNIIRKKVTSMGWGASGGNRTSMEILQYTEQRVVPKTQCALSSWTINSHTLCAHGHGTGGICKGDSGGPLVYNATGEPVQVGLASYVNSLMPCGSFFGPAVFSRISKYTDFIRSASEDQAICYRSDRAV